MNYEEIADEILKEHNVYKGIVRDVSLCNISGEGYIDSDT